MQLLIAYDFISSRIFFKNVEVNKSLYLILRIRLPIGKSNDYLIFENNRKILTLN